MRTVLLTGGCGFIGLHLVRRLLSLDYHVIVLDNLSNGSKEALPSDVDFIYGDAAEVSLLRKLLPKADLCVHLAAIASVSKCDKNWNAAHQSNFIPMMEILRCIQQQALKTKVVYASSAAVYGNIRATLSETSLPKPLSIYGADKLACESLAHVMSKTFHVPSIGLRFFNVFGPGQSTNSDYSGVITLFKEKITRSAPIVVYGDGLQTRDFIYIDDVIDAIIQATERVSQGSGVFNICTGVSTTVLTLAHTLMATLQQPVAIEHTHARRNDIRHSLGKPTLATQQLAFKAKISLAKGLEKMLSCPLQTREHNLGGAP